VRFSLGPVAKASNVQIDDYQQLARSSFLSGDGTELSFRVRWHWPSGDVPLGTSGVGFWNDPFMMTGWRIPSLPQATWVILHDAKSRLHGGLEPSQVGLHAMSVNAWNSAFLKALPLWFCSVPLWFFPKLRGWLWTKLSKQCEVVDEAIELNGREWNEVNIVRTDATVKIVINGDLVVDAPFNSKRKCGLVIWMDNQFLTWHNSGKLSFGSHVLHEEQWMEVEALRWREGGQKSSKQALLDSGYIAFGNSGRSDTSSDIKAALSDINLGD
jgi:hypothetical protein